MYINTFLANNLLIVNKSSVFKTISLIVNCVLFEYKMLIVPQSKHMYIYSENKIVIRSVPTEKPCYYLFFLLVK